MGRVDIARYANGAKIIENAVVVVQGGVVRDRHPLCGGPKSAIKNHAIPYVFNRSQAYMLNSATATCAFIRTVSSWLTATIRRMKSPAHTPPICCLP
jgi:hypothetical protein